MPEEAPARCPTKARLPEEPRPADGILDPTAQNPQRATSPLLDRLGFPGDWPRWAAYLFAVAATGATVALRASIAVLFMNRPLLIMFMAPIILSSFFGGLGPGLVATLIAGLYSAYLAMPPIGSFAVASYDFMQLCMLAVSGVLVSSLNEALHRSRQKVLAQGKRLAEEMRRREALAETLRDSEERHRTMLETCNEGIMAIDADLNVTYVNKVIADKLGYGEAELLALRFTDLLFEEDLALHRAEAERRRRGLPARFERRFRRKDGGELWVIFSASPLWDKQGRYAGAFAMFTDISERRQIERELVAARDAAEAASRTKSQFWANMSHELRTPLNGMLGMLHLLDEMPLNDDQKVLVETALESGRALLTIISDILNLSQIETGKIGIARDSADLAAVAESVVRSFRHEAEDKGIALSCEIADPAPPELLCDAGRLRQVLFNLLGNALKYTEQGRIEVRVLSLPRSPDPRERVVLFCVADTGIGIPGDKIEAVFEPFTQVDGSLTRRHQGLGIGLSLVRKLVQLLGGSVCVESEPGAGTTVHFTVRCGVPQPAAATAEPRRAAPPASFPGLAVLLAEDDRVNRIAATRFIERLGCVVTCAKNGREVLKLLRTGDFACVIMDIQMPEMNGIEATRAIRTSAELGAKAQIPIVAMTAHAMPGDREQFLTAGMDGYVAKPVEMEELVRVLAQALAPK
jgi:PAS domain S-box-containing protein